MISDVEHSHHDDHLRYLLDQRAARADIHARFPSQSDISDSPSLYSHGPFSPQPHDTHSNPSTSFQYTLSVHNHPHPHDPPLSPAVSDRERLNYPDASSLDLDDDPRSSYDQQSIRSSIRDLHESPSEDAVDDEEGDPGVEEHRVSTYGPKMTVHSRAPWEMDEEEEAPRTRKKKGGSKSPKTTDSAKKPWGLVTRPSTESRPSGESSRSLSRSKQSFETMSTMSSNSGGGAIFALAQASFSSTSVAITPSPQTSLRDKLSIPRLRSRTASSAKGAKLDALDTRSITPSLYSVSAQTSPVSHHRTTSPSGSIASHKDIRPYADANTPSPHTPSRAHEYRHPYANPEFARASPGPAQSHQSQQLEELHNLANSPSYASSIGPSESNATLTEASSSGGISQSSSVSTISATPQPSPQQKDSRYQHGRAGPINKASIRTVPFNNTPDSNHFAAAPTFTMPGWSDNTTSTIKLITLEEAQAQARERSRSITTTSSIASPTGSRFNDFEPAVPSPTSQTWSSRIRSASASSSKAKPVVSDPQAIPPVPSFSSEQAALPRTVVRKKSGFMRLFNGKDRASPPPIPSISHTSLPSPSSITSVPSSRKAPHRVPVPPISPPMELSDSADSISDRFEHFDTQSTVREQLSARRNVPGLSIVTSTSTPMGLQRARSLSPCASDATHVGAVVTPTTATTTDSLLDISNPPSSVPPDAADFLGLSIRPVSTMFSTDFAGHLVQRGSSDQNRPSLDIDSGTPTTSSGISPLSPGFSVNLDARSGAGDDKSIIGIASHQDDQSAVIQALQEQIMVARRAWQRQIWELEGQVRDLKAEVEEFRSAENAREYCMACGRGNIGRPPTEVIDVSVEDLKKAGVKVGGIVNRPRARTGLGSRFASGT